MRMDEEFLVGIMTILSFFSGGSSLPLGVPPEEDPFMQKVAPEECVAYVSWSGMKQPDPQSANSTEALLAEPEVQRIIAEVDRRLVEALTAGEADTPEGIIAEHGVALGRPLLMRPTAIFVESVELAGGPPDVKGGALVNLGEDAEEVKAALEKLQAQFAGEAVKEVEVAGMSAYQLNFGPDTPVITWGLKGAYLIVGVGEDSFAGVLARTKTEPPEWLAQSIHKSEVNRVSSIVHVNLKESIEKLLPLAGHEAEEIRFGLRALGLNNADSTCVVSGLDKHGFVSNTHLKIDGEALGLMTFVSDQPLTPLDLQDVPADATIAIAARADAAETYERFKRVVGGFEPGAPDDIDRELRRIEERTGLRIVDGIFKGLGDVWFAYNSPSEGGLIATGLTAAVSVKDKNKLQPEFDKLMLLMRDEFTRMRGFRGGRGAELKETQFGEHTIYYIAGDDDLWVAPSFCMTDEYVIFALFPQNVKAFLSHGEDMKSLATSEHVGPRMKMQGGPSLIVYQDTERLFKLLYPLAPMFGEMMAREMDGEFDLTLLPSMGVLSKHLNPGLSTLARDRDGVMLESRQSLPGGVSGVLTPLMLGMYAPAIKDARISAKRMQTTNNMKMIGLALHNYHSVHGRFPPAYTVDDEGKPLLSWRVLILPYMEEKILYDEFRQDEPWDSEHNRKLVARMPEIFRAPTSHADDGKTVYLGVRGEFSVLSDVKRGDVMEKVRIANITDGTTNTIMTVEVGDESAVEWTKPGDFAYDPKAPMKGLFGQHKDGFVAGFTDGSVRYLSQRIDAETLRNLFNRRDGQITETGRYEIGTGRRRGRRHGHAHAYAAPAAEAHHDHGDHDHDHAHEEGEAVREVKPDEIREEPREEPALDEGAKVGGKILLDGAPVEGAVVKYYLAKERRPTAVGTTNADGKFELRATGEALRSGTYRVTISKFVAPKAEGREAEAVLSRLVTPKKYASPNTTDLQVEVIGGNNTMNFELATD